MILYNFKTTCCLFTFVSILSNLLVINITVYRSNLLNIMCYFFIQFKCWKCCYCIELFYKFFEFEKKNYQIFYFILYVTHELNQVSLTCILVDWFDFWQENCELNDELKLLKLNELDNRLIQIRLDLTHVQPYSKQYWPLILS